METLSAASVFSLSGGGEPDSYIKSAEFNTARTILTLTRKDDSTVEVNVVAEGSTLPSGTEAGELALLLSDVTSAGGVATSGFYRYNGSSWDKIRDVLFIDSAESITIHGYDVPKLTNKQVTDAYNSIIDGRAVIIRDKDETLSMYADNASSLDAPQVAVYASFVGKLYLEYTTNDDGDDEDADISGTPAGGIVVDIGSSQYVYDGYSLPAIAKAKLDEIYANHKEGLSQVAKWTLLGSESYFGIVSADYIAGNYSVDLLVHNKYHCSYTWADATTGNVNPEVISGDLETFVFKGYVSATEPSSANLNELWYASADMPTTFPINVKRYDGSAWSTTTEQYTPKALEMWANVNDSHGYYWFNGWNEIDVAVDPDDVTIDLNATGQLQLKDKGHDFTKLTDASIGSGLEKSGDGTKIQHKNSVTAGDDDITLAANSVTFKKMHYDTEGHIDTNTAGKVITFRNGIKSDTSGNVEHTNSVTAQSTQKLSKASYDAQGHITGSTEITTDRGIDITSDKIGHTNAITAKTTEGLASFKYDAQGHITVSTAKTLGNGLQDASNVIGHTNAITAQTSAKIYASTLDAQGHHSGTQTGYDVIKKGGTLSDDDTNLATSGKLIEEFNKKVDELGALGSGMTRALLASKAVNSNRSYTGWCKFTTAESPTGDTASYGVSVNCAIKPNYTQIQAINFNTGIVYVSTATSGTWSAWNRLLVPSDITGKADNYASLGANQTRQTVAEKADRANNFWVGRGQFTTAESPDGTNDIFQLEVYRYGTSTNTTIQALKLSTGEYYFSSSNASTYSWTEWFKYCRTGIDIQSPATPQALINASGVALRGEYKCVYLSSGTVGTTGFPIANGFAEIFHYANNCYKIILREFNNINSWVYWNAFGTVSGWKKLSDAELVTSISSSSTDSQIPSAKAVYDYLAIDPITVSMSDATEFTISNNKSYRIKLGSQYLFVLSFHMTTVKVIPAAAVATGMVIPSYIDTTSKMVFTGTGASNMHTNHKAMVASQSRGTTPCMGVDVWGSLSGGSIRIAAPNGLQASTTIICFGAWVQ